MTSRYEQELSTAVDAVREAARLCREVQDNIGPDVLEKKDRSPVTLADFGSQALVCRALREAFPDDPIVAEEGSASLKDKSNAGLAEHLVARVQRQRPGATFNEICDWINQGASRNTGERFWTLDPIDGTKGFLRGQQYAISLALIVNGRVEAAALACPNLHRMVPSITEQGGIFAAVRGEGAWRVVPSDPSSRESVKTSELSDPSLARFCESFESGHSDHSWSAHVAERLGMTREPVRLDSQAKYAIVAMGEAEIYLRLPTRKDYQEKIWDHAGGMLLVEEAGGTVTDIEGRPLDFSRGWTLSGNRGVIVTGGGIHDKVLDAVASVNME